ncbi:MAG: CRISPR-associated endonuclease Cas2 [Synergistaceae bacterium]|nr:CRISPR-associated endonuclease Cas2 [Synergistaceae bacterium]
MRITAIVSVPETTVHENSDFTNNKLRRKFEKTLRDFGVRIQYSVFSDRYRCGADTEMREELSVLLVKFRDCLNPTGSVVILERLPDAKINLLYGNALPGRSAFKIFFKIF